MKNKNGKSEFIKLKKPVMFFMVYRVKLITGSMTQVVKEYDGSIVEYFDEWIKIKTDEIKQIYNTAAIVVINCKIIR